MELVPLEVQVYWWVLQVVLGSWVGKCHLLANSQPSLHSFAPADQLEAYSHQPGCCCMSLKLYKGITFFLHIQDLSCKRLLRDNSYHNDPVCFCQSADVEGKH